MKKNIVVFGLIAGVIVSAFMLISISICYRNNDFDGSIVLGYAAMLIAFSFIFVAVKNYRDKYNNGVITFGKGFRIGFFITLIASTIYVISWLIDYYFFVPDFMDRYTAHVIEEIRAGGASQLEVEKEVAKMEGYKEMYTNPLLIVLFTYMEILPVGLVVSLISALILKRTNHGQINIAG